MKIAIYHELPSGGAKHALYEMVSRLAPDNELVLYTHIGREAFMPMTKLVNSVVWLPAIRARTSKLSKVLDMMTHGSLRHYENIQRKLAMEIDSQDFDLVFVHASSFIQSPSLLRFLKTPTIYYSQEIRRVWYEYKLREQTLGNGLLRLLRHRTARRLARLDARNISSADLVCVNSLYSVEAHKLAYGIDPITLYLGVNTAKYKPHANKTRLNNSALNILVVGAMEPFKNQLVVAKAAILVAKLKPKLSLDFVFDRQDIDYTHKVTKCLEENKIDFNYYERLEEKRLIELYRKSDLVICVADLEPFGLTPLEAMACGTPVAAVKEAGYRETVVNGTTGVLFNSRDQKSIAEAIVRVESMSLNPDKLHDWVDENWNWDTTMEKLNRLMKETCRVK